MTHDSRPAFIARLKRRYLLGLITIAALSIAAYATLESALYAMSDDAAHLNRAGYQRAVSLQLLANAERLHNLAHEEAPPEEQAREVADSTVRLEQILAELVREHGSLLGAAIGSAHVPLQGAYQGANETIGMLAEAAVELAGDPGSETGIQRVRSRHADFFASMQSAVAQTQRFNEQAIDAQRRVVRALLAATAIVLLLESIFVFEPAIRSMRALLQRLTGNHDRMLWQACHDTLTGLSNRPTLVERMDALNALDEPPPFTLYFLDFDGFKSVNDTLGHEVGDRLLVSIAARLNEIAAYHGEAVTAGSEGSEWQESLSGYRLGGDEFVLLAIGERAHKDSDMLAHAIVSTFETVHRLGEHRVHSTASVGVFESDGSGIDVSRVLHNADLAMMRAKRDGKGRHAFFDRRMRKEEHRRETIEQDLFAALESEEIRLQYQPIVALETGSVVAVEALLHWVHPQLGLIDNTELVDVSSRIEGLHRLGISVLDRACRDIKRLPGDIDLHVNMHPTEVRHPDHRRGVQDIVARSGLTPSRLHLECTGGLPVRGQAEFMVALQRLCALGVQVGFDNVDREPISLRALADTPMSFVKLSPLSSTNVLDTFARLCSAVGLRTIGTNVESSDQHDQVRAAGFEAAQGFHLGRPMDIAELQRNMDLNPGDRQAA